MMMVDMSQICFRWCSMKRYSSWWNGVRNGQWYG